MKKFLVTILTCMVAFSLQAGDLKTVVLKANMKCEKCAAKIEAEVNKAPGVKHVLTLMDDTTVTITYDTEVTNEKKLIKCIKKAGYKAEVSADNDIHCNRGTKVLGQCCEAGKQKGSACCSDDKTEPGKCCLAGAKKGAKCCIANIKKAEANKLKAAQ